MEKANRVPLILRRPFLHTTDAIIRVKNKELNLGIGEDRATFLIDKAMQHSHLNDDTCFRMDVIDEVTEDELDALLDDSKPFLSTSEKISETPLDKEFEEFMTGNVQEDEVKDDFEELPPKDELRIKTSIQDPPTDLEMKPLLKHLEYAFLEENSLLPVVISALLEQNEKERLVSVLKNHKEAFAWKTSDIPGISPSFCKHKINFEDDVKPVIQRQRRLNPNMKEVVKKEIIKLLDAGIIYAIEDSPWVSPVHCVPKKGGMTVVTNEDNELVPTRTVTRWRVCIDYHKLNEATRKDHFPLPFMDQMLERLAGNNFFCFLDGFSRYFQIPIEPADQEKTTFTCPYGTYAYKCMPFSLCNAPVTFQGCMIAIFQDMLETSMEVFMDDFLFDIEIKNKKGAENVAADHLSRLEKSNFKELREEEINDEFPDEFLIGISTDKKESLWFADFANYLVRGILRKGLTYAQREKQFLHLHELQEDKKLRDKKEFNAGRQRSPVQLLNTSSKHPKLRSKRYGPFIVKHGYPSGYVELYDKHEGSFIVNIHQVKLYHDEEQLNELTTEEIHLMCEEGRMKAIPFMAPFPANYRRNYAWGHQKTKPIIQCSGKHL
ncbi:reverse transcriptase domain-containing protein [Tanacetum coccineum]